MHVQPGPSHDAGATDEHAIRSLYQQLLASWNTRNAAAFAALFAADGTLIGFDGSPLTGQVDITAHLRQIFADHPTAAYVGKIREVRFLTADVALVRAVAGMVPPGETDLNPAVNTMQTVVATQRDAAWRIALFQNTPAQFHGRPELVQQLTDELRELL